MPANRPVNHLLAYDIACPKRLRKVHRVMKENGVPLQYSVFMLQMTNRQLNALLDELRRIINEREDDIRVYPLAPNPDIIRIGEEYLSEGAILIDMPRSRPWQGP